MKAYDYLGILPVLAIFGLGIYGYIANIISLVSANETLGFMIARGAGILIAPLGAILGFF
jgi:hypothetical protein